MLIPESKCHYSMSTALAKHVGQLHGIHSVDEMLIEGEGRGEDTHVRYSFWLFYKQTNKQAKQN